MFRSPMLSACALAFFAARGDATETAFRLSVRHEGPTLVSTEQLASRFGITADAAGAALAAGGFALTRDGRPVAYEAATNGLLFFGRSNGSMDAAETVYRLAPGEGRLVATESHASDGVDAASEPVSLLPYTHHFETNNWCSILLDSRAGAGWITWQYLNKAGTYSYPCLAPGASGGSATLRVAFRSLHPESETDLHQFGIAWNGQPAGTASWEGQRAFIWEGNLPAGSVLASNILVLNERTDTLAGRGALDWVELAYKRLAVAESGRVEWASTGSTPVVAAGFTGTVSAWDVTDPEEPVRLDGISTVPRAGGFACGFRSSSGRRYTAFDASALRPPAAVRPDEAADLASATNAADWLAILPPAALVDFNAGAQRLAAFRAAQGLRVRLVTAEAVADTFGGGILSTGSIHRFVQATAAWSIRPRYLVLLGQGTVDYRRDRWATCLLPTPAVPVVYGIGDRMGEIVSADAAYGDDDGDGVPEVVVGRIPVLTTNELALAVDKIIRFETAATGKRKALFIADNPTNSVSAGVNIHASSDAAATDAASGGYDPVKVYVADTQLTSRVIRPGVMEALSNGPSFFLHLGHGDASQFGWGSAGNGILVNTLLGGVQSWNWPAVGLVPSCQINRFHHPGYADTFCLEAWRRPNTGFAALWAPSCRVTDFDGIRFGREIVKAWAVDAPLRLGDAVQLALSRAKAGLSYPQVLPCQTLLGDPAIVIRRNRSARNVPEDWLMVHNLATPNAGETDADGDSFPAWSEFHLGTDPGNPGDHPLRFKALAIKAGRTELRFASGPGSRYRLLRSSTLGPSRVWEPCPVALTPVSGWLPPGESVSATGLETVVYVPFAGATQFFRIEVVQ